jgi:hypothetical protein
MAYNYTALGSVYPDTDQYSWMYSQPAVLDTTSSIYNNPSIQNYTQAGLTPWQTDLQGSINNQTYTALGLDSNGAYVPTGNTGFSASNWASQNADLLKAGASLVTGGLGAWNGYQQNKLVRKNMNQQASQFREQMDISKQNINRNLEDRQAARVASNPNAYMSVSDYMNRYGVK